MSPNNSPSKTIAASSSSTDASYYSSASHIENREPHSTILHIENREPHNTVSHNENGEGHGTVLQAENRESHSTVSREPHHDSNISVTVSRSEERFSNSQTASSTSAVYNKDNVSRSEVNRSRGTVIEITPNSYSRDGNIPSETRVNVVSQKITDTSFSTRSTGYTESINRSSTTEPPVVSDLSDSTDVSANSGGNVQGVVSATVVDSDRVMDGVSDVTKDTSYHVEESVSIVVPRYD